MTPAYIAVPKRRNVPEIGVCISYDILAYGWLYDAPVQTVRDVTTDGRKALAMVERFNDNGLSLLHFEDAVLDMID